MRELLSPVVVCVALGAIFASVSRSKLFTVFTQEKEKSTAYRRGVLIYTWLVGSARSLLFGAGFVGIMLILGSSAWPLAIAAAGGYLLAWTIISVQAHRSVATTGSRSV